MKANNNARRAPPQNNGGTNGKKAISPTKPVPIAIKEDRMQDEDESNNRNYNVIEHYEAVLERQEKDWSVPFALSPEPDKAMPPPAKAAAAAPATAPARKPLKVMLNPQASVFVPMVVSDKAPATVVGEGVTKKELRASYAQQAQVLLEAERNEFSISYDEPAIRARVSHQDFEVLKMVGEGGFGRVYQVRHILTKRIYAMKTLRKKFLINTNNVSYTFVERNVLRKVRHPFICGLHFAFQTKGKVYLIMDFLNGGQIFYHLKRQTMFDETEVQFYAAEIALALSHLHSLGILHRDLKPENILLDGKGHVHLTDFGLARDLAESSVSKTDTYCVPEGHEILTSRGFMSLDAWLAAREDPQLRVAGYNKQSREMVFERPVREIVLPDAERDMVEFSNSAALSYAVTADHMVYVQHGSERPRKVRAADMASSSERARHVGVAEGGLAAAQDMLLSPEALEVYGFLTAKESLREGGNAQLAEWVWQLGRDGMRAIVSGVTRACGRQDGSLGVGNVAFRDQLMRVLLFGGFAASCEGLMIRVGECWPRADCVRRYRARGRVWCFTMPSGLFWVRRVITNAAGEVTRASQAVLTGNCGTVEYMAPEMVQGLDYGKEVDWWSLGVLLFDMLTGSPPWVDKNEKTLCDMIATAKLVVPSFLSDPCKSLLRGLLQRDVQKRFDMSALQSHDFFEGLDWAKVLAKEMQPPFVPAVPGGDNCTLNFEDKYIKRKNVAAITPSDHMDELSKSEEAQFHGFSFVRDSPDKGMFQSKKK